MELALPWSPPDLEKNKKLPYVHEPKKQPDVASVEKDVSTIWMLLSSTSGISLLPGPCHLGSHMRDLSQ